VSLLPQAAWLDAKGYFRFRRHAVIAPEPLAFQRADLLKIAEAAPQTCQYGMATRQERINAFREDETKGDAAPRIARILPK
jgi:hypothetical protein